MTTPEGRAAARREVLDLLDLHIDLHDLPRHLARQFGEWRERMETRYRAAPLRVQSRLQQLQSQRSDLAGRLAQLRASVVGAVERTSAHATTTEPGEEPPGEPAPATDGERAGA
jgi:hypothetical protein